MVFLQISISTSNYCLLSLVYGRKTIEKSCRWVASDDSVANVDIQLKIKIHMFVFSISSQIQKLRFRWIELYENDNSYKLKLKQLYFEKKNIQTFEVCVLQN